MTFATRCAATRTSRSSSSSGAGATPKAGGRLLDGRTWDEMPTPKLRAQALVTV